MIHVIGAGGHGRVVAELFRAWGERVVLLDRDPDCVGRTVLGDLRISSESEFLQSARKPVQFFAAVGDSKAREEICDRWQGAGHTLVSAVHPTSVVSPSAIVEAGACVMASAVVQTDCRVRTGAIINTAASVDHDGVVGRFAHIAPGAHLSGNVTVGDHAWIGTGAAVREDMHIGEGALIGVGAVVVASIPAGVVAHGNPCKVCTPA